MFVEVAQHNSMARAAETLHLTPPAASMQIKGDGRPRWAACSTGTAVRVSLSTAGEYFLVHAGRACWSALKDAEAARGSHASSRSSLLTVGLASTAGNFRAAAAGALPAEHPGVEVATGSAPTASWLVALMSSGEVDLAYHGPPAARAGRAGRAVRRASGMCS